MIYMDNAATTRMKKEVLEAMMPYFQDHFGNPSSLHAEGRAARKAVEKARESIGKSLGCEPEKIYFTSGATESNNLLSHDKTISVLCGLKGDHPSLIMTYDNLLPCNKDGELDIDALREEIKQNSAFGWSTTLALAYANGEVGTIQPAEQINAFGVPVHWDVTQAVGAIPLDMKKLKPYSMAFGAHKFGGPKGVGVLYAQHPVCPMIFGGGQERGVRSGTENVPAIVSMAKAVELAVNGIEKRTEHVRKLAAKLAAGILTDIGQTYLNGPDFGPRRLPGNVNISFGGCNGASLVLELDKAGIACSSGSACSSGAPSAILTAMYNDEERANASLRFTLNEDNTEEEVDRVLSVLPEIVRKERERENH